MASRYLTSRVDRFAGLSDRSPATSITRIESPDLQNIDFSDRALVRRKGFTRLTSECLKDSSISLNGYDDYLKINHITDYDPATRLGLSIHVKMRVFPTAESTILSRGYSTGANRFLQISYDPTINSNAGGWRCRIYDATNTTLRNVTVNDSSALENVRLVAFYYSGTSNTYNFEVYDADGTQVGSTATATVASFVSDTNPWFLGCDTNGSSGTVAATAGDSSYSIANLAEFRIDAVGGVDTAILAAGRELYVNASEDEVASLEGYWKFNDGKGVVLSDSSSNGNDAYFAASGPEFTTDSSAVVVGRALEFYGEEGHVQIDATSFEDFTFTTAGGANRNWSVGLVFTPRMAASETTVRNQTLFWTGTSSTDPEPLGLEVVSDELKVTYKDTTATLRTHTTSFGLSNYVNQKIRIWMSIQNSGGSDTLWFEVYSAAGASLYNASVAASTGPGTVSSDWSIGRKLSSFAYPQTFHDRSAFGAIDDFVVLRNTATSLTLFRPNTAVSPNNVNREIANFSVPPSQNYITNVYGIDFNFDFSRSLNTTGAYSGTAVVYPSDNVDEHWAEGLVCPNDPPEITMLRDYRRIRSDGTFERSILAVSGTSLYEVDPGDGSLRLVSGSLPKGGKWSHTQYADQIYMACNNGQRPRVFNGTDLHPVGIEPPRVAPVAVSANVGGSFTSSQTYHVYVTYRNSTTGVESNPSFADEVAFGASDNGFTSVQLPVSRDRQVNQRRIWCTAGNGGAGSIAYLVATVDDNTTVNYTTNITSLPATPTLEYLANEQAPVGAYVLSWKDRLWVAGNPTYPTRVYYSTPGTLTSFRSDTQFLDADQDAGDPVIGLKNLRDELIAYLRDGRVSITATGDTTIPFFLSHINNDVGAVSHHSILIYENRHIFLGERDVWLWAGEDAQNLSSPADVDRTSVKRFIRETLADAYKGRNAHIALLRARDQVWLACTTGSNTRNDQVLVLDISQGVWSKYLMDMDVLSEIEDDNDEPQLYGGSRGWIVKLDDSPFDGPRFPSGGGGIQNTSTASAVDINPNGTLPDLSGMYLYFFDDGGSTVERRRVARNTSTGGATDTIYLTEALSFTPNSDSSVIAGNIQAYADFVVDVGSPMSLKRIRWVKLAGYRETNDGSGTGYLTVVVQPDQVRREWTFNGSSTGKAAIWDTDVVKDFRFGGLGRSFRIMIADGGSATPIDGRPLPANGDRIFITEFQVEVEEVSAR